MLVRCDLTVRSVMPRSRAMCLFATPVPTNNRTCFSLAVSVGCGGVSRWASSSARAAFGSSGDSPRAAARIPLSNSSAPACLSRYPVAPARSASRILRLSENEVSTTTCVEGNEALIWRVASMPSMIGIDRSISTTSGSCVRVVSTADAPSATEPITSMSSAVDNNFSSPFRITMWSSAIRTRIMAVVSRRSWSFLDLLQRCFPVSTGRGVSLHHRRRDHGVP